jgi:hypothetical protein
MPQAEFASSSLSPSRCFLTYLHQPSFGFSTPHLLGYPCFFAPNVSPIYQITCSEIVAHLISTISIFVLFGNISYYFRRILRRSLWLLTTLHQLRIQLLLLLLRTPVIRMLLLVQTKLLQYRIVKLNECYQILSQLYDISKLGYYLLNGMSKWIRLLMPALILLVWIGSLWYT